MTRARRWAILAVIAAVAATAVVALAVDRGSQTSGSGTSGQTSATIAATDGVRLSAETYTPAGSAAPALVVMPVPFGSPGTIYRPIASVLQARGYEVVTYLQRGFHESQGEVDFAGPATQRDASTVITWALEHTPANAERVGMLGMSYGAGISLLTAAHDPRVRAVAAVSGWTDWDRCFDQHHTASTVAASRLVQETHGRLAASVLPWTTSLNDANAFTTTLAGLAARRSPQTYLAQLNRNKPAILVTGSYEDSFIPPAQLVDFVRALTTPKRLVLGLGDHGGPAYSGLQGKKNAVMDDAYAWLDRYLRGRASGSAAEAPYAIQDAATGELDSYADWPAAASSFPLGAPNQGSELGTQGSWSATLRSDTDSGANFGTIQYGPSANYHVPLLRFAQVRAGTALVWSGPPLARSRLVSGMPRIHLRIAGTSSSATVFAYLYELDSAGLGALMSAEPYTAMSLTPGAAQSVSFDLQPISWTVRAGDRLALVIDTADPRYTSPTQPGTTVTLSSPSSDPAGLSLPLG